MSTENFKFKVTKPMHQSSKYGYMKYVQAYASYHTYAYPIELTGTMDADQEIRLAILEVKHRLIQDILNAEIEFE